MAKAQLIDPREKGLRTFELKKPIFDAGAVTRADQALESMGDEFQIWLDADVERLQAARVRADEASWTPLAQEDLHAIAHDLKGLGATIRLGCSRPRSLLRSAASLKPMPAKRWRNAILSLARAHVDALRASVRDNICSTDHPIGRAVLQALETRVADLGVAPR
ncbi:MAG: Hpt domain-containing protein [Caulobacteraceae bacterium]|nr:Hpt domain-containing protein [Caulobacteraceae bacterium]